jgi:3-deoxy-manno-octulosonate cytidylyltransferase (CMP-KDO synthetase)
MLDQRRFPITIGMIAKTIIAVPARLGSSRLPQKVLADLGGKPMLQHVLERCNRAEGPLAVVLCTDSPELGSLARALDIAVLMTAPDCSSGSERIASVVDPLVALAWDEDPHDWSPVERWQRLRQTGIINVQADQPFLDPQMISRMALEMTSRSPTPAVITPVYPLKPEAIHNPNIVKALLAHNGRALYFSRSAVPHVRDVDPREWAAHATYWGHAGVYGFRGDLLASWAQLPPSPLETLERLEQLRLIEAGYTIDTFEITGSGFSVDTPEQLMEARRMILQQEPFV